jgi:hypothetical protein
LLELFVREREPKFQERSTTDSAIRGVAGDLGVDLETSKEDFDTLKKLDGGIVACFGVLS